MNDGRNIEAPKYWVLLMRGCHERRIFAHIRLTYTRNAMSTLDISDNSS